jgi:hypothetical protein
MGKALACLIGFLISIPTTTWAQQDYKAPKIVLDDIAHQFTLIGRPYVDGFDSDRLPKGEAYWNLKFELKEDVDTSKLKVTVVLFAGKEVVDSYPLKFNAECPLKKGERVRARFQASLPVDPGFRWVIRATTTASK